MFECNSKNAVWKLLRLVISGQITIATNMAGRGTDIYYLQKLKAGGLANHRYRTSRSRRVDTVAWSCWSSKIQEVHSFTFWKITDAFVWFERMAKPWIG
jgi:hypothetical protein